MFKTTLFILLLLPAYLFADDETLFRSIEEKVFSTNSPGVLASLPTPDGSSSAELFQQGLLEYQLGNLTTNSDRMRKSVSLLEKSAAFSTNVFNLSYLGIAHTGVTMLSGNMLEKSDHLGKAFQALDRSVELFPNHYLPRFYRSLLNLMVPGVFGGKQEKGVEDMDFVLARVDSIERKPGFKAFMVFMYANWLGEKGRDYPRAIALLDRASGWATEKKFLDTIDKKKKIFREKGGVR